MRLEAESQLGRKQNMEEQENILDMVQGSATTSTKISRLNPVRVLFMGLDEE